MKNYIPSLRVIELPSNPSYPAIRHTTIEINSIYWPTLHQMSFQFRLQTYRDEEGEYSEYLPADKNLILGLMATHWENDTMPNGLRIISISNENGQHLLLHHYKKHVFDVYFLSLQTNYHYHKKSTIDILLPAVESFFAHDTDGLEYQLNKTRSENDFIRGDFFYIDHTYGYTPERSTREGLWLLWYGLPLGIILLVSGAAALITGKLALSILALFSCAFGIFAWLPGLILHYQYKKDIDDITVKVSRGQDVILVRDGYRSKIFHKSEITSITKYGQSPTSDSPWADYGYFQIEFQSGEVINLSNLIIDQYRVMDKFALEGLGARTAKKIIPFIKHRTNINWFENQEL